MRSFTSVSRIARATWLLLGGCLLIALGVEGVTRVAFDRVSTIQHRMADEYRVARTIGGEPRAAGGTVLLVGNSLLDEDVRFDDVRGALGADWDARRFVVEQTFYLDWYYGLRRLFREGARPDVVIVMLSTRQWIRTDSRGDYSAHYLMTAADILDAARDLGLNATQTVSLALSNVSKFWGARAELRNFVLGHLMPDLGRLMDFSSVVDPQVLADDEVARVSAVHLARLKALTDAHGARLVILLPAVLDSHDGADGLSRAAAAAGIPLLHPVASGTLDKQLYRDAGFHLNPAGASEFTSRLIPVLREQLAAVRGATAQAPTTGGSN